MDPSSMPPFARVSVNIPQLTGSFDYHIPAEYAGLVQPGSLVNIPFGRQNVQGVVVSLVDEPAVDETRDITALVDVEPVLTAYQLLLAQRMAQDNLATLSQCIDLMVPPGLSQQADILIQREPGEAPTDITPLQKRLLDLLEKRGAIRGRQVDAALPKVDWRTVLPTLVKRGCISSRSVLPPPVVRPKVVRTVQFSAPPGWRESMSTIGRARTAAFDRRMAALEFLAEQAIPVNVSWVYAASGASSADLNRLAELNMVRLGETEIWRDPLEKLKPVLTQPPVFTSDQERVWQQVAPQFSDQQRRVPNLLVGVTGSGKTEIYLRAAAEALAAGKGVIILVPEIALTPQTVKRFFARFPGQVGLVHSKLSPGERYDTWRRIRAGLLPIVVGARSALFSPLPDPGLIIIDEAHDPSYRQEDTQPHYHAVQTAITLAGMTSSCILLGSATPGVETLYQFEKQRWNVVRLPNRVLTAAEPPDNTKPAQPVVGELPAVEVVDMRQELSAGNRSAISRVLHEELAAVLQRGEQAILFLNRRGSASYVFCRDCGYVLRCPRCETQLTYHSDESALICHTCNYRRALPEKCPSCGGTNIRHFGMGTESLESMVLKDFPGARVLRWDADTTQVKGAHDLILDHFISHRADILIGTQMLAKGLDLPLVTLVGVVLADVSLNLPDFRAAERTYQLLTQVAGRAGRSSRGGRVILQTFQPDHYAIKAAAAYDAQGFYQAELKWRQTIGYPPFSRLLKIEFRHTDALTVQKAALAAGEQLSAAIAEQRYRNTSLIGPVPCFYHKRAGVYRWQLIIRSADPRKLLDAHPLTSWQPAGLSVDYNLDPINLL
jgi:primosomal protein N' (replication factor Y)